MPPLAPAFGSVPSYIDINFEAHWCITNTHDSQTSPFQPVFVIVLSETFPSSLLPLREAEKPRLKSNETIN